MKFGLNEYVIGKNEISIQEGNITDMKISTGTLKVPIYKIGYNWFMEDEIERLVMPSKYIPTLVDMMKEFYFLNKDKRVAKLDMYRKHKPEIRKYDNIITITVHAYGKDNNFSALLKDIIYNYCNKPFCSYAHNHDLLTKTF